MGAETQRWLFEQTRSRCVNAQEAHARLLSDRLDSASDSTRTRGNDFRRRYRLASCNLIPRRGNMLNRDLGLQSAV